MEDAALRHRASPRDRMASTLVFADAFGRDLLPPKGSPGFAIGAKLVHGVIPKIDTGPFADLRDEIEAYFDLEKGKPVVNVEAREAMEDKDRELAKHIDEIAAVRTELAAARDRGDRAEADEKTCSGELGRVRYDLKMEHTALEMCREQLDAKVQEGVQLKELRVVNATEIANLQRDLASSRANVARLEDAARHRDTGEDSTHGSKSDTPRVTIVPDPGSGAGGPQDTVSKKPGSDTSESGEDDDQSTVHEGTGPDTGASGNKEEEDTSEHDGGAASTTDLSDEAWRVVVNKLYSVGKRTVLPWTEETTPGNKLPFSAVITLTDTDATEKFKNFVAARYAARYQGEASKRGMAHQTEELARAAAAALYTMVEFAKGRHDVVQPKGLGAMLKAYVAGDWKVQSENSDASTMKAFQWVHKMEHAIKGGGADTQFTQAAIAHMKQDTDLAILFGPNGGYT